MVTANESKSDSSLIGQQLSILLPEGTHGLMMLRMIATTVMVVMVVGWWGGVMVMSNHNCNMIHQVMQTQ